MTVRDLHGSPDRENTRGEAVTLLGEYLKLASVNPPGDTRGCVEFLRSVLEGEGIACSVLALDESKPNLVATLGEGDNALVLHHHMDVVPVAGQPWTVDPFAGETSDGFVYGRGAIDMKGFGILCLLTMLAVQHGGQHLKRPLRLLATSDEEVGGAAGAGWLATNHLVETGGEFLWTEGAFARDKGGSPVYEIQTSELGVGALRLNVSGRAGHASMTNDENPITRLARVLAALDRHSLKPTPTVLTSGEASNVVPAGASAVLDVRIPAGATAEEVTSELRVLLADPAWLRIEVTKWGKATASPAESSFTAALRSAITTEDPEATVTAVTGRIGTDARPYRARGVAAYGHIPFVLDELELRGMHGPDERVSLANLEHGLRVMLRVVEQLCL